MQAWMQALRIHQWSKNALIFVPLLTSYQYTQTSQLILVLAGFLSFFLLASRTYIINDIIDLTTDRQHEFKRNRPFANQSLSIRQGVLVAVGLILMALTLAVNLSLNFAICECIYLLLTLAYSFIFKRWIYVETLVLAFLYTLRIIAGGYLINVDISPWLLVFSIFVFSSLACMKRCIELKMLDPSCATQLVDRGYHISDLKFLLSYGIICSCAAIMTLLLYINNPEVIAQYYRPQLLWPLTALISAWILFIWFKALRAEVGYDPVIFAIKDKISLISIILMIALLLLSHSNDYSFLP